MDRSQASGWTRLRPLCGLESGLSEYHSQPSAWTRVRPSLDTVRPQCELSIDLSVDQRQAKMSTTFRADSGLN